MFANITLILKTYGELGTKAIKAEVSKISATGKTAESVEYEVKSDDDTDKLIIYGRAFFSTIETGRGPRKNDSYQGFDKSMLEYMKSRGIGADLPEKKREQLARFLAYKINKEGDKTYKEGGRNVYSNALEKIIKELRIALTKDFSKFYLSEVVKGFKRDIKKAA